VKNRRWAFLISIGLVFCLYTIVPQMARFGLVFFKYLTITPKTRTSRLGATIVTALEKGPSQQSRLGTSFVGGTTTQHH
jgi:hypothetical protein